MSNIYDKDLHGLIESFRKMLEKSIDGPFTLFFGRSKYGAQDVTARIGTDIDFIPPVGDNL